MNRGEREQLRGKPSAVVFAGVLCERDALHLLAAPGVKSGAWGCFVTPFEVERYRFARVDIGHGRLAKINEERPYVVDPAGRQVDGISAGQLKKDPAAWRDRLRRRGYGGEEKAPGEA
ncbi:MAG: hypothetical protein ACUVS7_09190 [Bryobacteraceae bacterium]